MPHQPDGQDGITEVAFCTMSRSPYFSVQFDMIERILGTGALACETAPSLTSDAGNISGQEAVPPGRHWRRRPRRFMGRPDHRPPKWMHVDPRGHLHGDHARSGSHRQGRVPVRAPDDRVQAAASRDRRHSRVVLQVAFVGCMCRSHTHTERWICLSLAFSVSSSDTLVLILDLALREHSVIVVSDNLSLVSASVFAIVVMIAPLQWQGVLLPILPQSMEEFLQAPVPFIAGVQRLPAQIASSDDLDDNVAVWFPEQDDIWLPRRFHGRMPGADRLIDRLRPRLQALQSRSRKVLYTCNNAQAIAVNNVTSQVADVVQRLVDDDHADECEGEQDAADREYRQRLRATQMMTQWKATTLP